MSMKLIDGKKIAEKIEENIKKSLPTSLYKREGFPPLQRGGRGDFRGGLAAILVGDNNASRLYIALKEKAAARTGIKFEKIIYPISPNLSLPPPLTPPRAGGKPLTKERNQEKQIINKIKELNKNKTITGIIVQLPLPKYLDTDKIINTINPKKDVDGYHPENLKKFKHGEFPFYPPVLGAVIEILKNQKTKKPKNGKTNMVLVSNSKIFPIPFQAYFGKNLTVCKFKDVKKYLPSADIIITAIGKKHYLKSDLIKKGATIIDVGIVREGKKIFGDADPASLAKKAGWLTPVPGGVGPITVACLLKNAKK